MPLYRQSLSRYDCALFFATPCAVPLQVRFQYCRPFRYFCSLDPDGSWITCKSQEKEFVRSNTPPHPYHEDALRSGCLLDGGQSRFLLIMPVRGRRFLPITINSSARLYNTSIFREGMPTSGATMTPRCTKRQSHHVVREILPRY